MTPQETNLLIEVGNIVRLKKNHDIQGTVMKKWGDPTNQYQMCTVLIRCDDGMTGGHFLTDQLEVIPRDEADDR